MYCPAANLVAPFADNNTTNALAETSSGRVDGQQEVSFQKDKNGNLNLHLILPAASVKFLNGFDENSLFNVDDQAKPGYNSTYGDPEMDQYYDQTLIEVACKVFEINKVQYKPSISPSSEMSL